MPGKPQTLIAFKLLQVKVTCRSCGSSVIYPEGVRAEIFEPPARRLLAKKNLEELLRLCPEAPRKVQTIERAVDSCSQCFEEREGFPYPLGIKIKLGEETPQERENKKKREKEAEELLDKLFG